MENIKLYKDNFHESKRTIVSNNEFEVTSFKYSSGIKALTIKNSRGYLTVLPFQGLMIWDAVFDEYDLKMKNTFKQPHYGEKITDSYGPFQFHSGLLANGNPGPEDDHFPHGEFPLRNMESSYIEINDDLITIKSQVEYVEGFGDHYFAEPSVTLRKDSALFDIEMTVKNLSEFSEMPLQYMVHLNYKFIKGAKLSQNVDDKKFHLRTSIPGHIHPTKEWLEYTEKLTKSEKLVNELDDISHFNPEIVYFGDNLNDDLDIAEFDMKMDKKHTAYIKFNTTEFPSVTRWLMYNPDLQVAAFALPATSRSEGRMAAKKTGTLIMLKPQEQRHFKVTTGLK